MTGMREKIAAVIAEWTWDEDPRKSGALADAILAILPVMGWQPIETAPRDGTTVLLLSQEAVKQGRLLKHGGCAVDYWHDPKRDNCRFTGWGKFNETYWPPSHWMPLPPPPADMKEEGQ